MIFKNNNTPNKLKSIKLLLLDVDGVLTSGTIIYDDKGTEWKIFQVKDGLGIRLLIESGIQVGIVTGRSSEALLHRCRNLGISCIYDNISNKATILDEILKTMKLVPEEIAFVGDDLPDIPLMKKAGLSIAVSDAQPEVIQFADMITEKKGGDGAVREVCEAILKAQSLWAKLMERFQVTEISIAEPR